MRKKMIRFGYTILYVQDVARSVAFYEGAFGLDQKFITPDNTYGELNTGETVLAFASVDLARTNLKSNFRESRAGDQPFGIEIGFTTDNVQETFARAVGAGAVPLAEAEVKPQGQTVAYVKDPDGFLVEICTPME